MPHVQSLLLVEDSDDEEFLFRHALGCTGCRVDFYRLRDAGEAIAALQHKAPYADPQLFPLPDIILTDLNMPRDDGFCLLKWMREQNGRLLIPTIVFSSSYSPEDIHSSYRMGANAFITKPSTVSELTAILKVVLAFWEHCQLPHRLPHV